MSEHSSIYEKDLFEYKSVCKELIMIESWYEDNTFLFLICNHLF